MGSLSLLIRVRYAPLVGAVLLAVLGGCSSADIPGVYRIDIQQGNVVTQDMLNQLEPGMEQRKVRFVLGTPMLADTFNDDRWDYIYSYQEGGGERVQRRVSVFFEDGKLSRVEGDVRPGQARTPVVARKETIVTVPPNTQSEGFFSALKPDFLKRKKKPARPFEETATRTEPAAGQPPAAPAPEPAAEPGADAASAAVSPPAPTLQEQVYLEELFKGFGTPAASGTTPRSSEEGVIDGRAGAAVEDRELGVAGTGADAPTAEPSDGETSYLKRLLERLREAGTPTDAPAGEDGFASPRESAAP